MRVVGIVAPFAPLAVDTRCNFEHKWKSAQEMCAWCPQLRYAAGEPGKVQVPECVGIVEGSCGYRAPGVSDRGIFLFYFFFFFANPVVHD